MKVTIFSLDRLNNTSSGNARYKVHTSEGSFNTDPDNGLVYMIHNGWRGKDSREAEIELDNRSRICSLRYTDGEN